MVSQKKKWYRRRGVRTVFLALFATASFIGAAIFIFDVEPGLMLSFFIASVLCLLILILAAFLVSLFRKLLRNIFGDGR